MRVRATLTILSGLTLILLLNACGNDRPEVGTDAAEHWVSSWGAATTAAYPIGYNTDAMTRSNTPGVEHSFRLMARTTLGGRAIRLRFSNSASLTPLSIGAVRVGLRQDGASIRPGSSRSVTFSGLTSTVIPAGGQLISDPIALTTNAGSEVSVSFYLPGISLMPSVHAQAFQTNYATAQGAGDATTDDSGAAFSEQISAVPVLEGIDVLAPRHAGAIVVLGDSLSDGVGSTFDGHDRWPDQLAGRLQHAGIARSVVNEGLTGNSIDCPIGIPEDGPNAVDRLDRDVLSKSGISLVFLFEGTNDLANFCTAAQLKAAMTEIVARVHAKGIAVVGATLIPRTDIHFSPLAEADRRVINDWIRHSEIFDHVVDFDAAVRAADGGWDPQYDSGDQVHLNPAGYRKLADAIDLEKLRQ
ncbi:MAG: GDSL-type esterase/lipase family protein [Pseudomonadota bacterium]